MSLPGSAMSRAVLPDGADAYPAYETARLFEIRAIEAVGFIERAWGGLRQNHRKEPE